MKILLMVLLCVVALAAPSARAETIFLSDTPGAGICGLALPPFSPTTVYVVHTSSPGATGSAWSIENAASGAMIFLAATCGGVSVDPSGGFIVNYGGCLTGTNVICQLTFMKLVGTVIPGCYQMNVRPHPLGSNVVAFGCDESERAITGGYFTFDLYSNGEFCDDCATATEATTWGAVKSLYR
jgi:hypothetical protein